MSRDGDSGPEEGKEKERLVKLRDTGDDNEMIVAVRREEKKKEEEEKEEKKGT